MKDMKTKILLLALALVIAGCNEKVDPSLDKGNSATPDSSSGDTIAPDAYVFKIENTSDAILNYNVHRTGAGNAYTKCEISRASALLGSSYVLETALTPVHDNKIFDYTCFFEAEELSLFYSGMKFKLTASQNTCEYIGYSPFSYYKYMPGNSSKTAIGKIMNGTGADCTTVPVAQDQFGEIGCGTESPLLVDTGIAAGSRSTFTLDNACAFDYTSAGGPNCDTGIITYTEHSYTVDPLTLITTRTTVSGLTKSCGGKVANCISGPIKLTSLTGTRGTELTQTEKNKEFTREFDFKGGLTTGTNGNVQLANYRRDLAAYAIDFGSSVVDYDSNTDTHTFSTIPLFSVAAFGVTTGNQHKNFDPRVIDLYSAGKKSDGIVNGDLATDYATASTALGHTARPLASDAFLGYGTANRTSPFYTFLCMDQALEVKARIRLVVRDWDRVFYPDPNKTLDNFELISDIFRSPDDARMDNPTGIESTTDDSSYNHYNDLADWDDILFMERDDTVPLSVIWKPVDGYFNAANFPGY